MLMSNTLKLTSVLTLTANSTLQGQREIRKNNMYTES